MKSLSYFFMGILGIGLFGAFFVPQSFFDDPISFSRQYAREMRISLEQFLGGTTSSLQASLYEVSFKEQKDLSDKEKVVEKILWKEYENKNNNIFFRHPADWLLIERQLSPPLLSQITFYEGERYVGTLLLSREEQKESASSSVSSSIPIVIGERRANLFSDDRWYRIHLSYKGRSLEFVFPFLDGDVWKLVLKTFRFE